MKKIEAIIKPFKMEDVKKALAELGRDNRRATSLDGRV
jgi:nitrogen regulatory protein PII